MSFWNSALEKANETYRELVLTKERMENLRREFSTSIDELRRDHQRMDGSVSRLGEAVTGLRERLAGLESQFKLVSDKAEEATRTRERVNRVEAVVDAALAQALMQGNPNVLPLRRVASDPPRLDGPASPPTNS